MVRDTVRTLWAEPRAAEPPARVWRDWVLVAVLVPTALLEGLLRDDVVWRPVSVLLGVALPWTLLWRRTHPLAAVVAAFGTIILTDIASVVGDAGGVVGLNTTIFILLFPYSLVRWGSGREIGIGLALIEVTAILGIAIDYTGVVDSVVGFLFLQFPATLGATVRYWTSSRLRELDQVKLRERAQLARELHDTVAHHVSAIAIRAQAGRVLAATHPEAALEALDVIDEEASLTLAELRAMVGGLRDGAAASLVPQPGVADLERLAGSVGDRPIVEVDLSGDLDDLRPSVGSAVYRIAQESVTNAVRHARHATHILVRVAGDADSVRVTVSDDGQAGSTANNPPGYGLVGMTERAALLGGSLEAGPGPERGWTVDAVLPRSGVPA
jgi:signal transduction histidine kinase